MPAPLKPILLAALTLGWMAASTANPREPGSSCGAPYNLYGPFDYRTANNQQKQLVEGAHFRPQTEQLVRGVTAATPGHDIQYTLAVFPNHIRALVAMDRLVDKEKRDPPEGGVLPIECWYERALRFRRDDLVVRTLFAEFLVRRKRQAEAIAHLDYVVERADDDAGTHFNAGLVYLDAGAADKALRQAHRAIALGYPRPLLRERLQALGQWREPAAAASPPASAASAF